MKNLCTIALCVGLLFISFRSSAQNAIPINQPDQNRPKLFENLPDNVPVQLDNLLTLLDQPVGRDVNISMSAITTPFNFQGNVVSAVSKYENTIQSVVVRSTNYPGAALTLSRVRTEAGELNYVGRIISMQHGDVYELKNTGNGFAFVKKKFYSLVAE